MPYAIPWKRIWASQGTPLSDATEEKQWRKLLHRALNTCVCMPVECSTKILLTPILGLEKGSSTLEARV